MTLVTTIGSIADRINKNSYRNRPTFAKPL